MDPLATGVLIVGIGRGTKHLNDFIGCAKSYETVVLFGKSTDTYDVAGKIVSDAPHEHVTRELVEEQLSLFRGKIKQVPPIYSALKINGMKAYEYARTGKELPRELETREMVVDECEMLDFNPGGRHKYRWPATEANEEEKALATKLMKTADRTAEGGLTSKSNSDKPKDEQAAAQETTVRQPAEQQMSIAELNRLPASTKAAMHTHDYTLSEDPADGPAARVRLTVSSGFYVRSFAHDLGLACGSYGTMAELARTQQGRYTTENPPPSNLSPCLTYQELEEGEEVWGPKITTVLSSWMEANSKPETTSEHDGTSGHASDRDRWKSGRSRGRGFSLNHKKRKSEDDRDDHRIRNSSSPE